MKFVLSVLAVLALAGSLNARSVHVTVPRTGSGALAKEMQDFMDLIPVHSALAILKAYAAQDKEFQIMMKLVDSEETALYVKEIEAHPAAKDLMNYIQNAGLDINLIVKKLNAALKIESVAPFASHKITGGLHGLVQDLAAVIPLQQLEKLVESKIEQSPVFIAFVNEVVSVKYLEFYDFIYTNEHVVKIARQANEAGIDNVTIQLNYVYWIIARELVKLPL